MAAPPSRPGAIVVFVVVVVVGGLPGGARDCWRFFAGAALATALLVPVSLVATGGPDGHRAFMQNTRKHQDTPLVNHLGLRTVLAWRPDAVGRHLHDERLVDPWAHWKRARLDAYRETRWLNVALVLGYLLLLARAARPHRSPPPSSPEPSPQHQPLWVLAALGVGLIALGVELTSYYYSFVIAAALLHAQRQEVGRWLLMLTAFTQVIVWAPLKGMATWSDEQHTAMAAASVLVFGAVAWLFGSRPPSKTSDRKNVAAERD